MASYFDPKYWSPLRAAELGKSWLDQWVATTAAWVDPVATLGAGTVTALLPDVVLTALLDGVAGRFGGRSMEVTLGGTPVRAVLDSMKVRRTGASFRAEAQLSQLDWHGLQIEKLTAVATGVRLIPNVPARLEARQVDLEGDVRMSELTEWLNGRGLEWTLEAADDGLIHARHRKRNLTALVDASVRNDEVWIVVHDARWHGLPIPRVALPQHRIALGPMPNGVRIVKAVREGGVARFTLDVPAVSGSFDLTQIRDAVVAGTRLIVW